MTLQIRRILLVVAVFFVMAAVLLMAARPAEAGQKLQIDWPYPNDSYPCYTKSDGSVGYCY